MSFCNYLFSKKYEKDLDFSKVTLYTFIIKGNRCFMLKCFLISEKETIADKPNIR